jgi:RNA polymerase sigma-70 factor, ECF subfamily
VGTSQKLTGAVTVETVTVNGLPGIVVRVDGEVNSVITLEVADGQIRGIFIVANPEKLRSIAG